MRAHDEVSALHVPVAPSAPTRAMLPDTLSTAEFCALLQLRKTMFYRLRRTGVLERLRAAEDPSRWDTAKVLKWLVT